MTESECSLFPPNNTLKRPGAATRAMRLFYARLGVCVLVLFEGVVPWQL